MYICICVYIYICNDSLTRSSVRQVQELQGRQAGLHQGQIYNIIQQLYVCICICVYIYIYTHICIYIEREIYGCTQLA